MYQAYARTWSVDPRPCLQEGLQLLLQCRDVYGMMEPGGRQRGMQGTVGSSAVLMTSTQVQELRSKPN